MLTEATGEVTIEVPRDRDGSFEPQIVKKRQRRLNGVEEVVLSLYGCLAWVYCAAPGHAPQHINDDPPPG